MSPFPLARPFVRALSLTAISVLLVSISLAWASRQQAGSPAVKSARNHSSPALLPDRRVITSNAAVLDNLTVTTNADSGAGSLRQAIGDACDGAAIGFDMSQVVSPVTLTVDIGAYEFGTILVTNTNDNGAGSLRQAIGDANASSSVAGIAFDIPNGDPGCAGGVCTITLSTGELVITHSVNMQGPGANALTISGNHNSRVFNVHSGTTVTISSLTIANGNVSADSGGGILNDGTLTVSDSAFVGNSSSDGAGISTPLFTSGVTNITGCLFANNTASNFGSGVAIKGGTATVTNTTFSGNLVTGAGGGAFFNDFGSSTLTNLTITNNRAVTASEGGGLRKVGGAVTMLNSIVAGNFGGASPSTTPSDITGNVSGSFNLIGIGGSGGLSNGVNGNLAGVANPGLGALGNNGGLTQTHALLAGSPALDAGDNTLANNAGLTTDQRGAGFSRIVDGPDADTTATVDIGAFEAQVSIEDIADKSTNEDTQLQFAFNLGGGANITSVTATSSNTTLVPNNAANIALSGSGSTRTLTINPAANQSGTATITVTVNGGGNDSMADTFVLTVSPIADTPSVTNAVTNEDVQSTSGLVISRNAADGAEVTHFKITNITNGALFKNNGSTAINNGDLITFSEGNAGLKFTPAANLNSGSSTFSFQVQGATSAGGAGLSPFATATITVSAVNDPPSFTKGADQTVNEDAGAQSQASWATSISDGPNESGQTVTFTVTNNNNALFSTQPAVGPTGTLTYTPAANANGSATATVTAKDDGGTANGGVDTSASQTFTITVNAVNDAPSFTKGADQTVNNNAGAQTVANWAMNISAGPSDESSQTLAFQVTGNTSPSLFTVGPAINSTGTLTYTPASSVGGTATITINLKDNGGTANGGVDTSASQTFTITVTPVGGFVNFASSSASTTENSGSTTVNVARSGNTSLAATVNYATNADSGVPCSTANGIASPKCDFTAALGTLNFAAGETSKPITILISQDSFVEGPENITLTLSNPTGGSALGTPASMSITIADDATEPPTNIIDDPNMFVRMHYHDFLNREADQSGLNFWTGQMTNCGASDLTVCRVNVSGAFFLSIEFQQTGYLVERIYKVGYGDATASSSLGGSHQVFVPVVRANEFLTDTQRIGRGVVVLQPGWEQVLENNKQAYALEFVQTARFISALPTTMTPTQFVDKLNQNAGNVLSPSERTTAINLFGIAADTTNVGARAQVLRQIAEDQDLYNAEFNRAFVLTEFFGYLRRNPNDLPDSDYTGYEFWLTKLNQFNGDYIGAEMVKAFIASSEYRQRFGP